MGIFDFLTPKADGLAYDPMRLPVGADPENDPVVGYDELGQKIRRSRFDGTQYLFEMAAPKTQSVIKGAYREATANPLGFTGDLLSGAVQSAWDAISVPARSMAGQPLTYGDIAGLTGMMTLGAGAGTAPAGALRMGAAREGRPPVTFADAERAMRETPGIQSGQGSDIQRARVQELVDKYGGDAQAAKESLRAAIPSIPAESQDFWQRTLDNFDYLATPKPVERVTPPVPQNDAKIGNPEYSTGHTAPHPEKGAMIYDLSAMFPDIATNGQQYYGTGMQYDNESFGQISRANGRPNASIYIYRAVPKDVNAPKINEGDWVTTSLSYAKEHGEANLGNKYKILKKTVRADELATNGDSIHEWGYWPKTKTNKAE